MTPAEHEFARMLARSSLGDELRALEGAMQRLVFDHVFTDLEEGERRRLGRMCADAGGRALYGFVGPFAEAVAAFALEHPDAPVQHDRLPAEAVPPRAGEWIRSADGDGIWHLFAGDLRLRTRERDASTFAEARCGRLIAISTATAPATIERSVDPPASTTCRPCRRAAHRTKLRARRRTT